MAVHQLKQLKMMINYFKFLCSIRKYRRNMWMSSFWVYPTCWKFCFLSCTCFSLYMVCLECFSCFSIIIIQIFRLSQCDFEYVVWWTGEYSSKV